MRFTLAACLALMAFVAVVCFLLTTQPSIASYFVLIAIAVFAPACAVAGIVYGRDNLRAFCIGAALPLALLVWTSIPLLHEVQFDPAAYGWSRQPSQTSSRVNVGMVVTANRNMAMRTMANKKMSTDSMSGGTPIGSSGPPMMGGSTGAPMMMPHVMSPVSIIGGGPSAHQVTLNQARSMTKPTCSFSIAAVLSGMLVMALRGGLVRKEPTASGNAGG